VKPGLHLGDVEKEPMPVMISRDTWEQVKRHLRRALERPNPDRALRMGCPSLGIER
jgi:hypothetical protein